MQNMNTNADIQDDDGKDETNAVHPPRIIPKPQTNNSSKMENDDDDDICKCGNPSSHQYECALYCGNSPCWDTLVKLPRCDHYLHESCLEQLLYTRLSSCPLCRSSIDQWRRSKHYHHIEEEIADAFRADTDLALQLSKKLYEEEQRRKKALEKNSRDTDSSESSRDRERDRDSNRNRNRNRSRDEDDNMDNRNRNRTRSDDDNSERRRDRDRAPSRDRDRGVNHNRNRFRSFFNRARSRSRSRHRRNTNSR